MLTLWFGTHNHSTSSYAELVRSIERKLRELNAPPAS